MASAVDALVISLPDGWVTAPHWARLSDLVGQVVRVRPYYHVPSGPGESRKSVRSEWTTRGEIVEVDEDTGGLIVRHLSRGPWGERAFYALREVHHHSMCRCDGCRAGGGGIKAEHGA